MIALVFTVGQIAVGSSARAATEIVVLRSGNAPVGNPDPSITMLVGSGGAPLSAAPFTPADFDAACGTANAIVAQPYPVWAQQLACDPDARWIGIDAFGTPASALYCYEFDVQTCCIDEALFSLCWATDDALGDPVAYPGPNPDGVYLNGIAVSPSIFGGNYASDTLAGPIDVTGLVQCGVNRLQVYNRDAGFVASGVIFSARLEITDCSLPTEASSWGSIKHLYR